jgi:hypothetical protein
LSETKSALKVKLFEALQETFPEGEVTVKEYSPGHPKLAARRIIHAQLGARVLFPAEGLKTSYAVAGMLPATAVQNDIDELVARLADDKRRVEISLEPGRVF